MTSPQIFQSYYDLLIGSLCNSLLKHEAIGRPIIIILFLIQASFSNPDCPSSDGAIYDTRAYTLEVASSHQLEGQQTSSTGNMKDLAHSHGNNIMHTF